MWWACSEKWNLSRKNSQVSIGQNGRRENAASVGDSFYCGDLRAAGLRWVVSLFMHRKASANAYDNGNSGVIGREPSATNHHSGSTALPCHQHKPIGAIPHPSAHVSRLKYAATSRIDDSSTTKQPENTRYCRNDKQLVLSLEQCSAFTNDQII